MTWLATVNNLKIGTKLLVVITTITFVTLLAATAVNLVYQHHALEERLIAEQQSLAKLIADRSTTALAFADPQVAAENLGALQASPNVEAACIYDAQGALFAAYSRGSNGETGCPEGLPGRMVELDASSINLVQAILVDDEQMGTLMLHASLAGLERQTRADLRVALSILFGALALAIMSASILQRLVTRPIVRLSETAALITRSQIFSPSRPRARAATRSASSSMHSTICCTSSGTATAR